MSIAQKHKTVYDFTAAIPDGSLVSLSDYAGQVLLIVNTASACGFAPQLRELQKLYALYKERGFTILAFPSNDFGKQEPLSGENILHVCQSKFQVTFPVFDKIRVKGDMAHPLYTYLSHKEENGRVNMSPKWNFHKYLIDRNGRVVDYFLSLTKPMSAPVVKAIEKLL
ncbi:MAG: glutathione peroxidase [Bacteroidota bacterium]|jgi:glutathione peroxidase